MWLAYLSTSCHCILSCCCILADTAAALWCAFSTNMHGLPNVHYTLLRQLFHQTTPHILQTEALDLIFWVRQLVKVVAEQLTLLHIFVWWLLVPSRTAQTACGEANHSTDHGQLVCFELCSTGKVLCAVHRDQTPSGLVWDECLWPFTSMIALSFAFQFLQSTDDSNTTSHRRGSRHLASCIILT